MRGVRKGKQSFEASLSFAAKRDAYLSAIEENRNLPPTMQLREVHIDESYYIHKDYHRNDNSVFDPNDDQDIQTRHGWKDSDTVLLDRSLDQILLFGLAV
jgi:hypothetical protein